MEGKVIPQLEARVPNRRDLFFIVKSSDAVTKLLFSSHFLCRGILPALPSFQSRLHSHTHALTFSRITLTHVFRYQPPPPPTPPVLMHAFFQYYILQLMNFPIGWKLWWAIKNMIPGRSQITERFFNEGEIKMLWDISHADEDNEFPT